MDAAEYKAERTKRHLSQVALAWLLCVTQGTISDRETGRREITRESQFAIESLPAMPDHVKGREFSRVVAKVAREEISTGMARRMLRESGFSPDWWGRVLTEAQL